MTGTGAAPSAHVATAAAPASVAPSRVDAWLHGLHPDTLLGALVLLAIFVVIGVILSALLRRAFRLLIARDKDNRLDRMTAGFLTQMARVFVWLFVLMLYAHTVPVLNKLGTALLASVSIASVVLGLAAQSTLSNVIAGLSLIFFRPFRLGDRIEITAPTGVESGIVETVSLGYTRLLTWDNRRIMLPNSVIGSSVTINLSAVAPRTLAVIPISIGYDSDIAKARAIALELARAHKKIAEVMDCPVVSLGSSSVNLALRVWCDDPGLVSGVTHDLLEQLKLRYDAAGIEMPYAYQNVILVPPAGNAKPEGGGSPGAGG